MKQRKNLSALVLTFVLLLVWQMGAMGMDAAYILPSPHRCLPACGSCVSRCF